MRTIMTAILAIVFVASLTGATLAAQEMTIGERLAQQAAERQAEQKPADPHEALVKARVAKIEAEKAEREALKQIYKNSSDVEKQARRELQEEADKTKKQEEKAEKTFRRAEIAGCDETKMSVNPKAVSHPTINSFVKVRVVNLSSVAVDIMDAKFGTLVEGLCPGGSMTLFRNRSLHSPAYTTFSYTATGRFPNGSVAVTQSEMFFLSKYDWQSGEAQRERNWFIQLQQR